MDLKVTRQHAGSYKATTPTGAAYQVEKLIDPRDGKTWWYHRPEGGEAHGWHATKRDAVADLKGWLDEEAKRRTA